jgi:small-conductance mechanosensitive channel
MSNNKNSELEQCTEKLEVITSAVKDASQACQGDVTALLALLRQLEKLHKEIRDGIFQDSLPDNRQRLYSLLKDIESEGGWPYIERMRLQAFLVKMDAENPVVNNTKNAIDKDKSSEW